jgi:autotransporter-associated beta strand protein
LNDTNTIMLNAPNGSVPEGTYTLMTYASKTGSGTLTLQNGTTSFANAELTVGDTAVTLTVGPGGLTGLGLVWKGDVSGVWDGGILNWVRDGTPSQAYVDGDIVVFDDSGSDAEVISSGAPVSPLDVYFNNTNKNYTVSAIMAGTTTLAKTGFGTTTLTGANTYTGATTISGGTLKLSGSGRLSTTGTSNVYASAISLGAGATFEHAGGTQTLSGAITGGGNLLLSGAASGLILSGSGSSYGSLTLASSVIDGRAFIGNTGALPAAATVAINGGTFVINATGTFSSPITAASGVGISARQAATLTNVTLPGSGSVVFNNDDASTNLLTISKGQTLTGPLTVQVGGNKMLIGTTTLGAVTLSGKLTGDGSLVVTSGGNPDNITLFGTGVLTLTGPNDYTGDTTVDSGVLAVTGASIPDTGKLVINEPGKLNLTGDETVATLFFGAVQQPEGDYSASSVPPGATITTASFTGSGTLKVVPAANNFAAWINTFFPGEINPAIIGAAADPDNDGIANGVEMLIGGDPKDGMDTALLPTIELVTDPAGVGVGEYLLFTYRRSADSETAGVTATCETDTDLVGPWTPAVHNISGVVIQEDLDFNFPPPTAPDTDRVRVYVPRGANTEIFGRLNVLVP